MRLISDWVPGMFLGMLMGVLVLWGTAAHAQNWNNPVRCASKDGHYARCAVPWRNARLIKQESKGACIRGQSWGMERGVLWVDRGCRGLFGAADGGHDYQGSHHGGNRPGPGWDRQIRLQCDSNKNRYQLCRVDLGAHGRARLVRQMSKSRCTEGYSWGSNRAGVWVAHGCRGQFLVDRRW